MEYKKEHPEGKIRLLDGSELTCYEKQVVADEKVNEEEQKRLLRLFTDNAFYLLAHRDRIFSDSRMFLCPVAVKSGLSISGTCGFQNPTLGVYLEWWHEFPQSMITDMAGNRSLLFHLAGSGLTGANRCSQVDENGKIYVISVSKFLKKCCTTFIGINTRYSEAKQRYQAYSLEEVLEILHAEDDDNTLT